MYCAQKDNLTVIRHCQGLLLQQRSNDITATSVLELAVEIIKFMNPAKLALPPKKPGPSPSTPPQDWYFKEFYRASESIMEGGGNSLGLQNMVPPGSKRAPVKVYRACRVQVRTLTLTTFKKRLTDI